MKRSVAILIALFTTIAGPSLSEDSTTPLPTQFEIFAKLPNSLVTFSKEVGSIRSSDASVSVTALEIEDSGDPDLHMGGVRFDLESNGGTDFVLMDYGQLMALHEDIVIMGMGMSELDQSSLTPYRILGTARCRMPDPAIRILCPSYRVGPDWKGLVLSVYGGQTFSFPDHRPHEILEQMDSVITALEEDEADGATWAQTRAKPGHL